MYVMLLLKLYVINYLFYTYFNRMHVPTINHNKNKQQPMKNKEVKCRSAITMLQLGVTRFVNLKNEILELRGLQNSNLKGFLICLQAQGLFH